MDGIIENLYVSRELYSVLFGPICSKYKLTMTQMLVLLFLSKDGRGDTASDIVERLKIAKSHVSASVHDLEERGFLRGSYEEHNHRTVHLHLCGNSDEIVREGRRVQEEFISVLSSGFTDEEKKSIISYIKRMNENANGFLREYFNL